MDIPWPQETRANQLVILDRLTEISGDNKQLRGDINYSRASVRSEIRTSTIIYRIRPLQSTREITNSILSHWSEDKR